MADCFWTNKVGVTEDCGGGPTPPSDTPMLVYAGATHGTSDLLIPYLCDDTGAVVLGTLQFDNVSVYNFDADHFAGCDYQDKVPTADAAVVGDEVRYYTDTVGDYETFYWALIADITGDLYGSATNVVFTNNGADGSSMTVEDLMTAIGWIDSYSNNGFVIVGVIRNLDTDETWTATGLGHTCY